MPVLDFKGKSIIYSHHLGVPFRDLIIDEKKSFSSKDKKGKKQTSSLDDNLIIHGDNLHALKALLSRYAGKIKCIYIDPPYNTGNEGWKYSDNVNSPVLQDWLKQNGINKDDLERHDKWLCMMWPRLQLLRELLSDDGVIFISIGSDEIHNLISILNEIFNVDKPFAIFIWKKRSGVNDSKNFITEDHDYVICYRKMESFAFKGIEKDFSKYKNPDHDPRGPWIKGDLTCNKTKQERPNLFYTIKDPKTGITYKCNPDRVWRTNEKGMKELIAGNKVIFPSKGKGFPTYKRYLSEVQSQRKPISTLIEQENKNIYNLDEINIIRTHMNAQATKEIASIFGKKAFETPKPKALIENLIFQCADANDIVLDSFAGSGTTAHAVLALNKEDGGNRKFILVECEGYADKITAERVRRVIKGVPKAKDEKLKKGLGGSFTYCTLGNEISTENLLKAKNLPSYEQLAKYVYYTATGEALEKVPPVNKEWFIGEAHGHNFHLIYKPDKSFLKGKESALNFDVAEQIKKFNKKNKKTIVFASHHSFAQKELKKDYNIYFCHLPYDIHRIVGA